LRQMADTELDLLVIGGGITGAGIAWDASLRGLNTGLVEMRDFASGTSSRSTKLVHGGLRYLKQGEVNLVREVGKERAILHKNAPHIVIPEPMLLPVYKGGTYGYWMSSIGLYIYDWLAGVKRKERRKMFRRLKTMEMEPLFKTEGLIGSGYYYEYRTDDARLTIEIHKTARRHGAHIVNYARTNEFIYREGRVAGVHVEDVISGKVYDIYARKIVNAAGPWVDQVRKMDNSLKGKRLLLTKGVHLVVDHSKLPIRQAAYFDVPDGRMIFVIPREGKTYIGTTDTVYEGDILEPRTTKQDRDYLLNAVNAAFKDVRLTAGDVESCWAGLRPLIYEEGKGPSEISRKDEIFVSESGLITIAGGKLTGFRKMAEKVVDLVVRELSQGERSSFRGCTTDRDVISGGDHSGFSTFAEYQRELIAAGKTLGLGDQTVSYLLSRYGSNVTVIYETIRRLPEDEPLEDRALRAEVHYAVHDEMAVQAIDFILRRTGLLLFNRKRAEQITEKVIGYMAAELGWDEPEKQRQRELVRKELDAVLHLPDGKPGH